MRKLILAVSLLALSGVANAVPVYLIKHQSNTSDGAGTTMLNGTGAFPDVTTATWDWDGTTLTATGTYAAAIHIGSTPYGPSLLGDTLVDWSLDTSTSTASATSYTCANGTFLGFVEFCGGYDYGKNYFNESTVGYSGTTFAITCGGDDTCNDTTTPIDGVRNLSAYNFGLERDDSGWLIVGNGNPHFLVGAEWLTFSYDPSVTAVPVPAAAWLFGSALGLLGWMRRRATV